MLDAHNVPSIFPHYILGLWHVLLYIGRIGWPYQLILITRQDRHLGNRLGYLSESFGLHVVRESSPHLRDSP